MKYCAKCGKELFDEAVICPGCGCPTAPQPNFVPPQANYAPPQPNYAPPQASFVPPPNPKELLQTLSGRVKTDGIIWLVIGILQIGLGLVLMMAEVFTDSVIFMAIIGVINIVTAIQDLNYSKSLLQNPVGIVKRFKPLAGPIISIVYNAIFGGLIGVGGAIYHLAGVRSYVMDREGQFLYIEQMHLQGNGQAPGQNGAPPTSSGNPMPQGNGAAQADGNPMPQASVAPMKQPKPKAKPIIGNGLYARFLFMLVCAAAFAVGTVGLLTGLILEDEPYSAVPQILLFTTIPMLIGGIVMLVLFLKRPRLPKDEAEPLKQKTMRLGMILSGAILALVLIPTLIVGIWASGEAATVEEVLIGGSYARQTFGSSDDCQVTFLEDGKCRILEIGGHGYELSVEDKERYYEIDVDLFEGAILDFPYGYGIYLDDQAYAYSFEKRWGDETWYRQDEPIDPADYISEGKTLTETVDDINQGLESFSTKYNYKASNDDYIAAAKQILMDNLANPQSATIHDASVIEKDAYGRAIVYLDVSAQKLGWVRNDFYVCILGFTNSTTFGHNEGWDIVEDTSYGRMLSIATLKAGNDFGENPNQDLIDQYAKYKITGTPKLATDVDAPAGYDFSCYMASSEKARYYFYIDNADETVVAGKMEVISADADDTKYVSVFGDFAPSTEIKVYEDEKLLTQPQFVSGGYIAQHIKQATTIRLTWVNGRKFGFTETDYWTPLGTVGNVGTTSIEQGTAEETTEEPETTAELTETTAEPTTEKPTQTATGEPQVTDRYANAAENIFVPQITIEGVSTDAVNGEIWTNLEYFTTEPNRWSVEYEYGIKNDVVSVYVHAYEKSDGIHDYYVYNVSALTGKTITNEEFISKIDLTDETYLQKLEQALQAKFYELYSDFSSDASFQSLLSMTIDREQLKQAKPFYTNESGLSAVAWVYAMVGADGYYRVVSLDDATLYVPPTQAPQTEPTEARPTQSTQPQPTEPKETEPRATEQRETETTATESVCVHSYAPASCIAPMTCTLCGETSGDVTEHSWQDATCTEPMMCTTCQKTSGSAKGHSLNVTKCQFCDYSDFSVLAKSYTDVGSYDATTGATYEVSNVSVSSSGTLTFSFNGNTYSLSLYQTSYDGGTAYFSCYYNGAPLYDANVRAVSRGEGRYMIHLSWNPLDGCNFYFHAEA